MKSVSERQKNAVRGNVLRTAFFSDRYQFSGGVGSSMLR